MVLCAVAAVVRSDERPGETIGAIDGEAIAVQGPMRVEVSGGEVRTVLLSGGDVRVKSGRASIQLHEGGVITICGPAHLSLLKSAGALTIALEYGTIHHRVQGEPAVTVFTPQIQVRPVAVGDAPVETVVGLTTGGTLCLRAQSGAVRIEQQLTGESVIVPQGGDVLLTNGQMESLRAGGEGCSCELAASKTDTAMQAKPAEWSALASSAEVRAQKAEKPADPPPVNMSAREEPVYKVLMPPLSYDASAPPAPASSASSDAPYEPSPATIILVRTVRVRPTLIFHGHVEAGPGESASALAARSVHGSAPGPALARPAPSGAPAAAHTTAKPSVMSRVRTFFRRLWNKNS